jgi:hypothetical protein
VPEPSRGRIGGLDLDKGRKQAAEQAAVGGVQFEITAEHFEVDLEIGIAEPDRTRPTGRTVERNDLAGEVAGDREAWVGGHEDEIAFDQAHGFVAIHGEPAFADQHEPKTGEIHWRARDGPTSGPLDDLRPDRAGAQEGNHIGKRFHVPDDL